MKIISEAEAVRYLRTLPLKEWAKAKGRCKGCHHRFECESCPDPRVDECIDDTTWVLWREYLLKMSELKEKAEIKR